MPNIISPTHRIKREFVYQFVDESTDSIRNEVIFEDSTLGSLTVNHNDVHLLALSTFSKKTKWTAFAEERIVISDLIGINDPVIDIKWSSIGGVDKKRELTFKKNEIFKPDFFLGEIRNNFVDSYYVTKEVAVEFSNTSLFACAYFENYIPVISNGLCEQELFYQAFYNIEAEVIGYEFMGGFL